MSADATRIAEYETKVAELERKVGQLTMEVDLLEKRGALGPPGERRQLLHRERSHDLDRWRMPNHEAGALDVVLPQPPLRGGENGSAPPHRGAHRGFRRYGYRRGNHQLRAGGLHINHEAVARVTGDNGLGCGLYAALCEPPGAIMTNRSSLIWRKA